MTFNELKKNLKKDYTGFKHLKLGLLGDTATQFLAQSIRGFGYEEHFNIQVFDADFNQVARQIFDFNSELYSFNPDVVVVFESGHKLLQKYNKKEIESRIDFADSQLNLIVNMTEVLQNHLKTKIIFFNYAEEDDKVFGNFANKVQGSFIFQQRKLNYLLAEYAASNSGFYICDMSSIQNKIGRERLFSPSIYINSEMVLSLDALPIVSQSILQIIGAFEGKIKKCLILDLDNTIWGGIIGDDGLEKIQIGSLGIGKAFTEFQLWIKKLQQRGIIICICSKNSENIAKEPFEKHPDMILRLKDIAVFMANWENKVDNIRHIQKILNIGFDSIIFLDDNPVERNIVRLNILDITVPELPKDPAEYLEYLYSLNLFETVSFSSEDAIRTEKYQKEAERVVLKASFSNEDDFLKSLNMISDVQSFNAFSIPRVAQLSQRSNQFNLRTVRYTEEDIKNIADSEKHITFSFTLKDKYGENGLISAIILEKQKTKELFIDTWIMSCRVLKRGMEDFVLNTIVDFALSHDYKSIVGEYLSTEKNSLVKNLYANLGFIQDSNYWCLETATYHPKACYINKQNK